MGRPDSKNETDWLGKVGGANPKKWLDLTQTMSWTDLEKWEGLTPKIGRLDSKNETGWLGKKDQFEMWEALTQKMGRSVSKHGRSESNSRQVWLEEKRSCWHPTAIVYRIAFFCKLNWITTSMEIIKLPY